MYVKPGVPWVTHSNPKVRTDIYSLLLQYPEVKVNFPNGERGEIKFPTSLPQEKQNEINRLAEQIGFDGIVSLDRRHLEGEVLLIIVLD